MKLNTIRLLVDDFAAAFAFWRDVMGFAVAFGPDMPGGVPGYAYFATDTAGLELMARETFADALGDAAQDATPTGQRTVLVLEVDDVDSAYSDLTARGATPVAPPRDRPAWAARTAHIGVPGGQLVELFSRLASAETPTV